MDRLTPNEEIQAGARWAPAMRALGDERLAKMVEGGSDSAFAAIYGRYAPVLHGYCRSLLRDEEEAGDALQNAMLKALQAMRRAGRSGPLRPWLFRIAHNESVTIIRQRTRRPAPLEESMVAGADDAFRRAAAREQLAALLSDMQNLTEYQRGALVMRELGGLTYDEIGTALDTTPLAARQAVFVARRRLSDGAGGDGHPRRLRPALQLLIGPAPAGLVFLGAVGGGAGVGVKLVATAAAVSIGVGSVELVVRAESDPAPKRQVAAASPQDRSQPRRARPQATATAAPTVVAPSGRARRSASAAATPAPEADSVETVSVEFVSTRAQARATPEPTAEAEPERAERPEPEATPEPESEPQPEPRPDRPERHRPAPEPTAAPPAPAAPPPAEGGDDDGGHHQGGYTAQSRGGRDCPPGAGDAPNDDASVGDASVVPVQ